MKDSIITKCQNYLLEEPDQRLRQEIEQLLESKAEEELLDRMGKHCHFGTAGLRASMQAGYNRMNLVSIYRFSYALGKELFQEEKPQVVIGFDGRHNSKAFAKEVSEVLIRMGIEVHAFEDPTPTPICAYAAKYLSTCAAVMITASHNQATDNGVKVFGKLSAQINGSRLKSIEKSMNHAPLRSDFYRETTELSRAKVVSPELIKSYLSELHENPILPKNSIDHQFSVVYTPLHGVGQDIFLRALKQEGFLNVKVVAEQSKPDGSFPTVAFPNPEEEHTLDKAFELAERRGISWVFAHDPDADRLQVSYPYKGKIEKLSGNAMGAILGYFAIKRALEHGEKPLVATSIVSSRMLKSMAKAMNAGYVDGLTGFSNIVDKALKAESEQQNQLVFAYEEAIGFLMGKVVLDKDGINAGLRFMEIAGFLQKSNKTPWQFLDELYLRYGLFESSQLSLRFDGISAMGKMTALMNNVRSNQALVEQLFDKPCCFYDLLTEQKNGGYSGLLADVLIFENEFMRLIIRPSGTEPKVKIYLELMETVEDKSMLEHKKENLRAKMTEIKNSFYSLLEKGFR